LGEGNREKGTGRKEKGKRKRDFKERG